MILTGNQSLSRIENILFHRSLFVLNGMEELYTTTLPVFRWKAKGYDWILVDSNGQPSLLQGQHNCNELACTCTNLLTLLIT